MVEQLTWAQEQRINWIGEMLEIYGFINREHVQKKFRISIPQAASDFTKFKTLFPQACTYNSSTKRYETKTVALAEQV